MGMNFLGGRALDADLKILGKVAARGVIVRVLARAAKPIDDDWRLRAPHLSGELSESGAVGTKLSRRQAQEQRARAAAESAATVTVHVGPGPNPQAITQEFGTFKEPPQPFMRPAWEAGKQGAFDMIVKDMRGEIDKAEKRRFRREVKKLVRDRSR